jgi:hypothetical protein
MKWQDPEPKENIGSWSQHSWGNAIDVKPMQAAMIKKLFEKSEHTDHFHVSFKSKN